MSLEGVFIHVALPSAGLVSQYKPYMDLVKFMQRGETFDRLYMVRLLRFLPYGYGLLGVIFKPTGSENCLWVGIPA